jgi:RNA polymerase sigma-70 factor (ECF subfamily)
MDSEKALLARVQRFEEEALAEVYDCYSDDLYRYAWRLLGDECLAEECVAETFSRFLHAVRRGVGPQRYIRAYLYRVAHNWITDSYRRGPPPWLPLDPEMEAEDGQGPHDLVEEAFERQQVLAALRRLTPEQRQVIILRYLHEWTHEEIAHSLQKRVGAVKALQHRALNALRRALHMDEGSVNESELGSQNE